MPEGSPPRFRLKPVLTAVAITTGFILVYAVLCSLDMAEAVFAWTRAREDMELDELLIAGGGIGLVGITWFVSRRGSDSAAARRLMTAAFADFDGTWTGLEAEVLDDMRRRARRDAIVTTVVMVSFAGFAVWIDLLDVLFEFSRSHEDWEIDEVGVTLVIALFAYAAYSQRRWADHRRALSGALAREQETRDGLANAQRLAHLGHMDWHPDSGRVVFSDELFRILGLDPAAAAASREAFLSAVPTDEAGPVADTLELALVTGRSRDIEHHIRRPDGSQHTVRTQFSPVVGTSGAVRRLTTTVHDITERKRFEVQLSAIKTRFEQILTSAGEGIIELDAEHRILFANPAARVMTGFGEGDLVGRPIRDVLGIDPTGATPCGTAEGLQLKRAGGSTFPVEMTCSSIATQGQVGGMVLVFRDITETLADKEALRRSNAELQSFAYAVSHDLQEPLRMVSNYVKLLERRYRSNLDDDGVEFIHFAVDGAQRMSAMINDLLEYSRIDNRGGEFDSVDLTLAINHALDNLHLAIQDSGAMVVVEDLLPEVEGDLSQLTRLFQNLVGNAIKYRVPDRRPEVHVAVERAADRWTITVSDNGIGIDPKDFERIFRVFQRLHGRGEYEGTGIGLAVAKRIVERHGGRLWVESAPGRGATFRFTLPAAEARAEALDRAG